MKLEELGEIKKILLNTKQGLMNKTDEFRLETRDGLRVFGDEADLAATEINRNLSIRLIERETNLFHKIDRALEKISLGTYGLCEGCEEPLDFYRLKARPVASLCVSCKEEQEERERFYA